MIVFYWAKPYTTVSGYTIFDLKRIEGRRWGSVHFSGTDRRVWSAVLYHRKNDSKYEDKYVEWSSDLNKDKDPFKIVEDEMLSLNVGRMITDKEKLLL